jgi:hypothetical protein
MNTPMPNWIARLLGVNAESGEGVAWGIELSWPWPPWATLLGVVLVAALVIWAYSRQGCGGPRAYRTLLAAIRLALAAIVLLLIAQTTLSLKRTGLPYAAVLIDDSLSMTTVDQYAKKPRQSMTQRLKQAGVKDPALSRWNLASTVLTEEQGELLRGIAEEHKLRVYFLSAMRPSRRPDVPGVVEEIRSTQPSGQRTRLGAGVRAVLDELRGTTPAGVVILSDGINTDGPTLADAAEYARRRGVPLFTIGLGSRQPLRDLKLSDLLVDDVVFVDDVVNFECRLSASGYEGRRVAVVLREKDKPAVLAKVEVTVGADGQSQQVRIPFRPAQVGQFEFVVEVESQEGELQTENNRQSRTVEVRKEKIHVLLVQAYPSFEFRYLRNMLERDETIALRTVLQEADLEYAAQDASALRSFPLRREELFAYDVVIFGDVNPAMLNAAALQNMADFVDQPAKGGALVLIAGPSYMPSAYRDTPLARLLPNLPSPFAREGRETGLPSPFGRGAGGEGVLRSGRAETPSDDRAAPTLSQSEKEGVLRQGFVVQPTDLGLASPTMQLGDTPEQTREIWRSLAPLYWLLELPELKPGVRVLAEHPTRVGPDGRHLPVFCLQYVGAGKVLFHATDETWRWRYRVGDVYFSRYWVQTIRWLCRSKLSDAGRPAVLESDRREYDHGEPVRLRARFADERLAPAEDDGVTVAVELSGRQTQRVQLHRAAAGRGVFEGLLERPAPGDYHAWIATPALKGQAPAADFAVNLPAGELAQIRPEAGEMRRAAEATGGHFYTFDSAGRLLDDLPPGRQVPIESLPPLPLWNRWPVLALFLGLLIAEWILRKRKGMV